MTAWRQRWASALPRTAVVVHDLAMVWLAWNGLRLVRYGLAGTPANLPPLWSTETFVVLAAQALVLWRVGLYRGLWRFASVPDLVNLAKAGLFGVIAIGLGLFVYNRLDEVPRTVLLLYPFALVGLLGAPRLLYRACRRDGCCGTRHAGPCPPACGWRRRCTRLAFAWSWNQFLSGLPVFNMCAMRSWVLGICASATKCSRSRRSSHASSTSAPRSTSPPHSTVAMREAIS